MKWLLFLIAAGLGYYTYTQNQTIDTLTASLKQSENTVAELRKQFPAPGQARPAGVASSGGAFTYATPAPKPSWMNTTSDLDKTPVPSARRK